MTVLAQARPAASETDSTAVVAVVLDFVDAALPQFDRLLDSMGLSPGGPGLPGCIFHWSRRTSDGVRVTEVWHSQRSFEEFLQGEIVPRLSESGLRAPEITTYEVHGYLTQGSTAAPGE